jgi:hypothetical protein
VYRNSLFADASGGDGPEPPNLVRLRPGAEGYQADFVRPPFQALAPGWQVVSVARPPGGPYWLEWKRAAGDRTEFAYTSFDVATGDEKTISREEFRAAYGGVSLEGFVAREGRALDLLVSRIASGGREGDYLHISVGVGGGGGVGGVATHYLRMPAGSGEATRQVAVFAETGRALALEADGTLLAAADGSAEVRSSRLPALPRGFVYSDLFVTGTTLVAAWEQVDFYQVGRAGLLITPIPF